MNSTYPFPDHFEDAKIHETKGGRTALDPLLNHPNKPESKYISKHLNNTKQRNMQKSLEDEIDCAAKIQSMLFPAVLPRLTNSDLAARNRAASQCGGDYYDVLPISNVSDRTPYLICVADVCGKGIPASLLMSNLQATLHTALCYRPSLMDLVLNANRQLLATTPLDRYITAIFVYCEPITGKCEFVNAGHNGGTLIRSDGSMDVLETTGPPLGMMKDMSFFKGELEMRSGDVLSLHSDGVPEAFNSHEEEWGKKRFMNCLFRSRHLSPEEIITKVFKELDAFAANTPQSDDITMLVLKRKA